MYGKGLRTLSISTAAVMAVALGMAFFYAPLEAEQGFLQKIFYVHVPLAIVTLCGFIAGGLMATYLSFGPFIGLDYVIIMYSGVVLGGMGSILGAFWGGLTVGFVQQCSALVLPPQLQNAAIFVVFLMIVLLRPQGLFGRSAERA